VEYKDVELVEQTRMLVARDLGVGESEEILVKWYKVYYAR
jgi:hypothetical protein